MRTISCKLEDLKTMTLHIGYEGENDYTSVRIDAGSVFAQYPEAVPSLKVQPPKGNMYPVIVTRDGDIVIWNVSDSDTASNGNGEIQLTFTENTVVVKSCTGKTLVHRSLKATGPAPDPLIDFIDMAEEVVGEAQDAAEAAEAAAQHAPMIGLDGYWYKWDAETEGYVKTDTKARGEDGANGVGITSVEKISTVGLVDTYRINFTNGTNTTYTVTNGQDGSVPIDDTTPAANKVFSSAKVDEELTDVKTAIDGQDNINKAIISVFQHATFADAEGATTYNALYALVYGSVNPYQKVAFVETDGSSRIDTGVLFDGTKNIVVTMEMSFNGTLASNDSILNGWAAGGSMGVSGSQSGKWNEGSYPVEADLGYVDEMTTCVMTINAGTNTNTDYSFTNTHGSREMSRGHTNVANRTYLPFPLFALSKQDSFDFLKSGLRIKSVEIKVGGAVVRSMYACYRKSDNVIGFYDEMNDVFYTNVGTGSFTKGGDIA